MPLKEPERVAVLRTEAVLLHSQHTPYFEGKVSQDCLVLVYPPQNSFSRATDSNPKNSFIEVPSDFFNIDWQFSPHSSTSSTLQTIVKQDVKLCDVVIDTEESLAKLRYQHIKLSSDGDAV